MEDDRKKIREPFPPEQTPSPPQIIDPSNRKERNEDDMPIENPKQPNASGRSEKPGDDDKRKSKDHQKLLGDETEIEDETTI